MTKAQKRFTIQKLPRVLTLQLKRFDFNSMFGGKVNKTVDYQEKLNMRPFMSNTQVIIRYIYTCTCSLSMLDYDQCFPYMQGTTPCW